MMTGNAEPSERERLARIICDTYLPAGLWLLIGAKSREKYYEAAAAILAAGFGDVAQAKAEAMDECDRDWANYFASIGSHVGDPELTQAFVVKQLRGMRPFGKTSGATS